MAHSSAVRFEVPFAGTRKSDPSKEIQELVLGPFSLIPKLEFTEVQVGNEESQVLNLRNPTDSLQSVIVVAPKDFAERGFRVNAYEFDIPPYSKSTLAIHFKPSKELQCRDTIYIKDKVRSQKSQFQLTSRSVLPKKLPRKRKTWNVNKKPVIVTTEMSHEKVEIHPKLEEASLPAIIVERTPEKTAANTTFPIVSVIASSEGNTTYLRAGPSSGRDSAVFEDSLEDPESDPSQVPKYHEVTRDAVYTNLTFDSAEITFESNKENCSSAKKRRTVGKINFSDINFDDLTPDRSNLTRSCLNSIENRSHNTSTPFTKGLEGQSKPVGSVRRDIAKDLYPSFCQDILKLEQTSEIKIKPEPVTPSPYRRSTCGPPVLPLSALKNPPNVNIKLEPITPLSMNRPAERNEANNFPVGSETNTTYLYTSKDAVGFKDALECRKPGPAEPVTPCASLRRNEAPVDSRSDVDVFKMPDLLVPKEEMLTPIPQSLSVKKLTSFSVSPPSKTYLQIRRELFSKVPESTPNERKPKLTARGMTLSPKSLVAFKRQNVRVRKPTKTSSSSRPSSAKSSSSSSSESASAHIVVADPYTTDFKEPLYNLDIYGATTMTDPFARTAIHPLEYQDKQARQLIKWVNSVLTPPEEYSAYEAKVDVASLWKKSVAAENVPLAPSRETVCSKYHKNELHLYNLRKAANVIFKSVDVTNTLYKVHAKIDVGFISVKDDLDLHSDQGARYFLVDLLMCYNPLWLRIGLETIYGRVIQLQPKNTVFGLMHFIKNNLLSDKYIEERNSYQNIQHLKMPKFKKEMNDYIVFKFFSLVFFLDLAKRNTIVPYDPCLFNKGSRIKESEGMLNEFIKEFIKCVGHMKRTLATLGFVVSHKQSAIEEYDFAVVGHLDLRNGASLTRLMEIILQKKQLVQKLRLPAISRLQKVHNVKVAMSALAEEGVDILDVTSSDVVDGHKEKIMSLLWQILHKFLKPRLENAAMVIQLWWKKKSLKVEISKRIQQKQMNRLTSASVKIQAFWKGYRARKQYPSLKTELLELRRQLKEENAAITIQSWYRATKSMKVAQSDFLKKRAACVSIQRWYRQIKSSSKEKELSFFISKELFAVKIQRWYRSCKETMKVREEHLTKKRACIKIQQWYRAFVDGRRQRAAYLLTVKSVKVIQTRYRATLLMKNERQEYLVKRKAAMKIQQWYRASMASRKQRAEFLLTVKSVKFIQTRFRATLCMKKERKEYQLKKEAAKQIQQWYRTSVVARKQRAKYLLTVKSVKVIQARYRATLLMRKERQVYEAKREAASKIQQWYRASGEAKKQRAEYLLMVKSVKVIQSRYRATLLMRKERQEYQVKKEAAKQIQQWYRASMASRKQRAEFLHTMKSVKVIQTRFRATLLMRKERQDYQVKREAATKIQRWYRASVASQKQRAEYLLTVKSAKVIQTWYRATSLMRRERQEYQLIRKASSKIQLWYRASVDSRRQRAAYLLTVESVKVIQTRYRATLLMRKERKAYQVKREAAKKIQQWYRASMASRKQRAEFLHTVKSVKVIQTRFRATLCMKKERQDYQAKREAATKIQRWYHASVASQKQRAEYLLTVKSAKFIQTWYRATSLMRRERQEYQLKRKVTSKIQLWYRASVDSRRQRAAYLLTVESVKVIQTRYRATLLMRKERTAYQVKKEAATKIQQWYRASTASRKQRAEFLHTVKSVKVIQNRFRAMLCMKKEMQAYQLKKEAAKQIQQWYRTSVVARKQRAEYLLTVNSVKVIQTRYRARLLMRKERQKYQVRREAATKIQQWYRASVMSWKQRDEYRLTVKSVKVIQIWYRATTLMRRERQEYQMKRNAAMKIQQWYRASVAARKEADEYILTVKAVKVIQTRYRATMLMKKARHEYQMKREAATKIQLWYRASVAARKQRAKYLLTMKSIRVIKTRYRATSLMRKERQNYQLKKDAAKQIQQWYRASVAARKQRAVHSFAMLTSKEEGEKSEEVQMKKEAAKKILQWYRASAEARKQRAEYLLMVKSAKIIQTRYRATLLMRKEIQDYQLKKNAVKKIQRFYRATAAKAKQPPSQRAPQPSKKGPTLHTNYMNAIAHLRNYKFHRGDLNTVLVTFKNLDFITQYSPVLTEMLADPATEVYSGIYSFLDKESRSDAHKSCWSHGMNVLINLALYDKTYEAVWKNTLANDGISVLLILMGKCILKSEPIFCKAATLIWLFSSTPEQRQAVLATGDVSQRLTYYAKKLNVSKAAKGRSVRPHAPSHWGYKAKGVHREFPSRQDAMRALLARFNL